MHLADSLCLTFGKFYETLIWRKVPNFILKSQCHLQFYSSDMQSQTVKADSEHLGSVPDKRQSFHLKAELNLYL